MANTSSAKKKVRVIERKTISREMYRNKIKTYIKKVESLITEKDQKSAMELLKKVDPKLQASKNKKIFSKAKISRIQKRLNSRIVQLKKKYFKFYLLKFLHLYIFKLYKKFKI